MILEEIKRYDPYTDKSIKNTTADRIEVGTDGNLYKLSVSNGNEYLPKDKLYTKADIVAMLTEIQTEFEKLDTPNNGSAYMDCVEIIQQKINSLKTEIEPQESEE